MAQSTAATFPTIHDRMVFPMHQPRNGQIDRKVSEVRKFFFLYKPSVMRKSPLTGFGPGRASRACFSFSSQVHLS